MASCPDEDSLLALSQGALAGALRDEVTTHLDECDVCRRTVAALVAVAPVADDDAAVADAGRIGRYELIEPIGAGAMGIVFAARDPELDRKVAVKVLRRERGADGGTRLERRLVGEARALARLAHPNVIAAYEVGRHDGEVFLVMELVSGATLTRWLAATARSRRAIVSAFLQAGEGLAAAHAAGIVHRDFKPDNVLVGDDGRLRVTDFGLASGGLGSSAPSSLVGEVALTRTGALAGTPAFMAPEQLAGGAASPRSDQFAFAVALWGALYGVRPFAGDTVPALVAAARAGRARAMPERDVPARLRAVMLRALGAEPAERWPDMRALLDALAPFARPPAKKRRLVAGAVIGVVLATGVALGLAQRRPTRACNASADVAGLWDRPQRDAVVAAFAKALPARAEAVTAAVDRALARYRDNWTAARGEACRLGAAGAARTSCLDLQREQVDALVRLFGAADAGIADAAVTAVAALPNPTSCARAERRPREARPADVEVRARELAIRLAQSHAFLIAGRHEQAETTIDKLLAEIEGLGLEELRVAALRARGDARGWTGNLDAALADLEAAIRLAIIAKDDAELLEALVAATFVYGRSGRNAESALTNALASAVIERVGGDPDKEAGLAVAMCMRAWHVGSERELAAGRVICEDARRKLLAVGGPDDYRLWELEVETGSVAYMQGRYEDAIAHYRSAIASSARLHGPGHTRARAAEGNLAETLVRLGRGAEAVPIYEELLVRAPDVPAFLDGLALARRQTGDLAGALAAHERARDAGKQTGHVHDWCWGAVGVAEDLAALARWRQVPEALTAADEACAEAAGPADRGRVALVRARLRQHAGDERGATDAAAAALSFAAEAGDAAGPGAQLRGEVEAWQRTLAVRSAP